MRVFVGVGSEATAVPLALASTAAIPNQSPLLVRRSIAIGWPGAAPVIVTGNATPAARSLGSFNRSAASAEAGQRRAAKTPRTSKWRAIGAPHYSDVDRSGADRCA